MREVLPVVVAVATLLGCEANREPPKPVDVAGQRLYRLTGTIVGRSSGDNTVRVDHERVPGFMDAMTMDFSVRGAAVGTLPPDGTRIEARLHGADGAYWLSDVRPAGSASPGGTPP